MNTNIKKCPFCASEPIVDAVAVNDPALKQYIVTLALIVILLEALEQQTNMQ